jgi:hypothetical protein
MTVTYGRVAILVFFVVVQSCDVDIPGYGSYDLSPLENAGNKGVVEVSPPPSEVGSVKYSASFCGDKMFCIGQATNFIREADSPTLNCLGKYGTWNSGTYVKTSNGFEVSYSSDMPCSDDKAEYYSSTFNYICDPTAGTLGAIQATQVGNICKYSVDLNTDLVCKGSTTSSAGLSGGSIFLIILVSLMFLYFIVGIGFNYHKDRRFKTLHGEFWCRKLPYWTKMGCMSSWIVTLGFLKGTYRWCCIKIFKAEKDDKMATGLIAGEEDED